ncbi:MAG: GNAT family N-acetyltransferase [Alphaproteobacteria bacterium]|nr:GNAT family N-acetyltransferase [Alphaproteobacteria bacterium]
MEALVNPEEVVARVKLRPLTLEDFDELVALQQLCFPTMPPWKYEHLRSQLNEWPESQLGLFLDGRLVASAAHLIVDSDEYESWSDWMDLADGGLIRNHDPEGDTLYGIEMQVHPDYRGMKLTRRLYDARKDICRDRNLRSMRIGGRMPGYAEHQHAMTAEQYVHAVMGKQLFDPVLTAQLANGFQLREIIPDYLPSDEDSAGFATFLEWVNEDYVPPVSRRQRRATQRVRVGLVQYKMRPITSFEEFARQVEFFVDTAGDYRADFLLFPELFTLQLLSLLEPGRPGTAARRVAEFTPRYLALMGDLAVRYNVNIIGGSQFTIRDDGLYNVAYVFHRDGRVDSQDKLHVTPSEARWWGVRGGKSLNVIDTDRARIGLLVCYDAQFPELARKLASDGADLLFVPYNTNDVYGHNRVRVCTAARCIENHLFAVTAGCVGNLPFVENADTHYARSAVLTPSDMSFARGGIAAEADPNVETVLCHDLDLQDLRRHRLRGTVHNWKDRRKDLYQVRWVGEDDEGI